MKHKAKRVRLFTRLERIYAGSDFSTLTKIKSLFLSNLALFGILAVGIIGLIPVNLGGKSAGSQGINFSFIFGPLDLVLFAVSEVLLVKKHFKWSSFVNIFAITLGCYYLATVPIQPEGAFPRVSLYAVLILFSVFLYGFSSWLTGLSLLIFYLFCGIYLLVFQAPLVPPEGKLGFIRSIMGSALIFHASLVFLFAIFHNNKSILASVNDHKECSERSLQRIKDLFCSAQKGLEVGENVQQVANNQYIYAKQIDTEIEKMGKEVAHLSEEMENQKIQQSSLNSAAFNVTKTMDGQTSAIIETSSSVLQMTSNIRGITSITQEKKSEMQSLIDSSSSGARRIEATMGSINRIVSSSQKLLEVLDVIDDISSRTNLLAMNAAIEAAHAGEAGRGFSIVAEEIRKLAEETASNSAVIKQTLEENIEQVQNTYTVNQEAVSYFDEVNQKVLEFGNALNEIFMGMSEITNGTEEILSSIENIRSGNNDVVAAMHQIGSLVTTNSEGLNQVVHVSDVINKGMASITKVSSQIIDASEEVLELGGENLKQLNLLKEAIHESEAAD